LPWLARVCALALFATAVVPLNSKEKEFVLPRPADARTYPAHDEHPNEKATSAADPYNTKDKAEIFTVPFLKGDILPIYVVVSNEGTQPISLMHMKVEFVTAHRARLTPATADDIWRRLGRPGTEQRGSRMPLPIPLPREKPSSPLRRMQDEVDHASFHAKAADAGDNQAGFFFFDVQGLKQPLAGARLYVTGLHDATGNEMFYFEIPFDKYLAASASK
jgi:hypothetical protein